MKSMTMTESQTDTDWRYSEERMKLRQECLAILLKKYGGAPSLELEGLSESIYSCVHDWVSQGHKISSGITAYYNAYYNDPYQGSNQTSQDGTETS